MKSEAEGLRLGLIAGLVDVTQVVDWADRLILADRHASLSAIYDLSLSSGRPIGEVVSLLGVIPGEVDPHAVGRRLAADLATRFDAGDLDVVAAARAMFRMTLEGFAADEEFVSASYRFDDAVDLAREGVWGTLDDVHREMMAFLERYRPPNS